MSALTSREATVLAECEQQVERGLSTFLDVGRALLSIRDGRLYRANHATFASYCQDRWGMSVRHAERMVQAAEVAEVMRPTGRIVENEAQARELAPLLDQPEKLRETWQQVNEQTGGKPTAAAIRDVVRPKQPLPEGVTEITTKTYVDENTGEVLNGSGSVSIEQHPDYRDEPLVNPVAAARAEVAKQPVIVTEKAVDYLRRARLAFLAAGTPAEIIADLANSHPDTDNTAVWLSEIETSIGVLNGLAVALRRRNLRSVSR